MMKTEIPASRPAARPWFQFSLFRLMVLVTLLAVLLGLASLFGDWLGTVIAALIWCVLPTPLVICAIYGRRDVQAFSIGALIPWAMLISTRFPPLGASFLLGTIWVFVLGFACGAVAVVTRRWLMRNGLE